MCGRIVPLISSFQDDTNLYLVMDYMPGGDFLGLLIRENILDERVTRHYIAEMVVCIEEAHRLGFIHRDVKPDNFLIDARGHLKVSDFGLAFDGQWHHDTSYYKWHREYLRKTLGIRVRGDEDDRRNYSKTAQAPKRAHNQDEVDRHEPPQSCAKSPHSKGDIPLVGDLLDWRMGRNRSFAHSVVGTSQYMAPEVVKGDEYDGRCD